MKALVSRDIAKELLDAIGIEVIPLVPYGRLDVPVASHADMLFSVVDNKIFCYEEYVKENNLLDALASSGKELVFVSCGCDSEYPKDVSLNVLWIGKALICKVKSTAKEILDYAKENGYVIVDVKQGYTACSTLVLNENCAITTDKTIFNALEKIGKEALLIPTDGITLKGYNCGFIGGATGVFDNTVVVFGQIDTLGNYSEILHFLERENLSTKCILAGGVYDFGGFKLI